MIKCAIFDLDGTLVDSMEYWAKAPIEYLKKMNLKVSQEMIVKFFSLSLKESADYIINYYQLPITNDDVCKGIDDVMEEAYTKYVEMKPNMLNLLEMFYKAGVKMAIASATDKHLIIKAIRRLNIEKYFSVVVTCGEVNKNKTFTDVYDKARETLGFKENETIVFEDLPYGIISCKEAGYHTFGIFDKTSYMHYETIEKNAEYSTRSLNEEDILKLKELTTK